MHGIGATICTTDLVLVYLYIRCWMRWNFLAIVERIPVISRWTRTDRVMTNHLAQCVSSTNSRAWILALLIDTSFVQSTIRVFKTLRLAIWGFTKIASLTLTNWSGTKVSTS